MKIFIKALFIMAIIGWHSSIQAQISVGGRLAANIANVDGDGMDTDAKFGLDIAVVAEIPVSEAVSVQPELHFLQKGYTLDFGGDDFKRTLNYIEIPVLAKYNFGSAESVGGFVVVGPSVGFGVGVRAKLGDETESGSFDEANLNAVDFGAAFGGGVNIPVSNGNVVIDVRYLLGLTDIFDGESEVMNRGVNFGVGYVTPIGGE